MFLCHASRDEDTARKLKDVFERYFGFDVFIFQEGIDLTEEWDSVIIDRLKKSKLVVPIITENLKPSQFANQEIGIAIGWRKKIISIKMGEEGGMGFLGKFQACVHKDLENNIESGVDINEGFLATAAKIFKHLVTSHKYNLKKYKGLVVDSLLYALSQSPSFKTSMLICDSIVEADKTVPLLGRQILEIKAIMKTNSQVKNSDFALKTLEEFLSGK